MDGFWRRLYFPCFLVRCGWLKKFPSIKYRRSIYVFVREILVKGAKELNRIKWRKDWKFHDFSVPSVWPSHRCASPLFLGALSSSSILDSHGSKYRDKLNSFLDPVLQTTGRSRFVRCWHTKTDGWAVSTFHSNCDGKGPTVTIVQVGSYIFGGYTDKSWSGTYQFITALMAHRSCSAFSCGLAKTILLRYA